MEFTIVDIQGCNVVPALIAMALVTSYTKVKLTSTGFSWSACELPDCTATWLEITAALAPAIFPSVTLSAVTLSGNHVYL